MLDAFWKNRLGQGDASNDDISPEVRRPSRADDETTAELIVQGLVEYDSLQDTCQWIGPEHGSAEYIAWIKKRLGNPTTAG
jgi:hypothetical protein